MHASVEMSTSFFLGESQKFRAGKRGAERAGMTRQRLSQVRAAAARIHKLRNLRVAKAGRFGLGLG